MSTCCVVTSIPGPTGDEGSAGTNGTDGVNAFTLLDGGFTMPNELATVVTAVENNTWMVLGQPLYVQSAGFMQVAAINPNGTGVTLKNLADSGSGLYPANAAPGSAIPAQGKVAPAGFQGPNASAAAGVLLAANNLNDVASTATARNNLGLGSMALQAVGAVAITGGSITGITDLAVADGGTGASTAANARTNLGLGTLAVQAANAVAITGGSATGLTSVATATFQSTLAALLSGTLNLVPTTQALLAATSINPTMPKLRVSGSGGLVILTSTPTIQDGANDGQLLLILGTSNINTVTFQSDSSLAGSNLRLQAATRTLGIYDQLLLSWDAALAEWIEVSFANNS